MALRQAQGHFDAFFIDRPEALSPSTGSGSRVCRKTRKGYGRFIDEYPFRVEMAPQHGLEPA